MKKINLVEDILPLSEFRSNASSCIERVKSEKRPLIITQHGKSSAVLMGVIEYQALIDKIQLFSDVEEAKKQLRDGEGLSSTFLFNELREKYRIE